MTDSFYFDSCLKIDGKDSNEKIFVSFSMPKSNPRAVIQISHGMVENSSSYREFAKYLTSKGYAVAINDHLGHGKTAGKDGIKGYFGNKYGFRNLITDMRTLTKEIVDRCPGVPIVLLGHSMGSMLARKYIQVFADNPIVCAMILLGPVGKTPLATLGLILAKIEKQICGGKTTSKITDNLLKMQTNQSFHKKLKIPVHEKYGPDEWLTRDEVELEKYYMIRDAYWSFTNSGYVDLMKMNIAVSSKKWYKTIPENFPIGIFSGSEDPISNFGKGAEEIYNSLFVAKNEKIHLQIYDNCRHELLKETNRDVVFADIVAFIENNITK